MATDDPFVCIQCGDALPLDTDSKVCDDCAQELADLEEGGAVTAPTWDGLEDDD
jgi:transcription initiation factor IIE alpha subunit